MIEYLTKIYTFITWISIIVIGSISLLHIMGYLKRKTALNLNANSLVVVIGGCMGIGRVMTIEIAKKYGAKIILVDRRKDLFKSMTTEILKHGSLVECYLCDLSEDSQVDSLIEFLKQKHSNIDFLLYNAGVLLPQRSYQHSILDLQRLTKINFLTPIAIINGLIKCLQGGHIAIMCSISAYIPSYPYLSSYVGSKQALFGFMNSLRMEMHKYRIPISISIGCPSFIRTSMVSGVNNPLMQSIFPFMDEQYAGKQLLKQFILKKQIILIPRSLGIIIRLIMFFPSRFLDNSLSSDRSNHEKQIKQKQQ